MKRRRKRRKLVESASSQSDTDVTITDHGAQVMDSNRLSQLDINESNQSTQESTPSLPISDDGAATQRIVLRKSTRLMREKEMKGDVEWKCSRCTFVNQFMAIPLNTIQT